MKPITQQWLEFAKTDILCCEKNLNDEFLTSIIAFHSQQIVEKCFKAVIEENESNVPRIHNLIRLHKIIKDFINFPVNLDSLTTLDEVYTTSRYPGETGLMPFGKPSNEQANEMYESAKYIYEKIIEMFEISEKNKEKN
jgi:HEPN domain-containing protein